MIRRILLPVCALVCGWVLYGCSSKSEEKPFGLPALTPSGRDLLNPAGVPVVLRGVNLGNWFLFEKWMMEDQRGDNPSDHVSTLALLDRRFGVPRAAALLDIFRANWIADRDFKRMRSYGFNVVRLPFHYAMLEDPAHPGELRADAFRWIDHAVQMAASEGIYTILDMHGAPGGQSLDHVCGEKGRNEFWRPENRRRGAALWRAIAEHYRGNPAVVAYDLLNEPYGRMDMTNDDALLITSMGELIAAVRSVDSAKLIYVAGTFRGIEFYGPPAARGWRNVGYTEHFYPGLYGDEASLQTQARLLNLKVPARAALLRSWNAPFLVGEFNPVLLSSGGAAMLRMHFGRYADERWAATMWSYKMIQCRGGSDTQPWTLVKNKDPIRPPDLNTATYGEIEAFFRATGTMDYAESTPQIDALRAPQPGIIDLPAMKAPSVPPSPRTALIEGWRITDVGDAYPRAAMRFAGGNLAMWGGGRDVFAVRDEFGFGSRLTSGDFELSANVSFVSQTQKHAKAGLMARAGLADDAPLVMVHLFPDGTAVAAIRWKRGAALEEHTLAVNVRGSARFSLARKNGRFTVRLTSDKGEVRRDFEGSGFPAALEAGPFVLSHDTALLQEVLFHDLTMTQISSSAKPSSVTTP